MGKSIEKSETKKARTTNGRLKTMALWLAIGICLGIIVGPYLPPETLQLATLVLKSLISGALKSLGREVGCIATPMAADTLGRSASVYVIKISVKKAGP